MTYYSNYRNLTTKIHDQSVMIFSLYQKRGMTVIGLNGKVSHITVSYISYIASFL